MALVLGSYELDVRAKVAATRSACSSDTALCLRGDDEEDGGHRRTMPAEREKVQQNDEGAVSALVSYR